MAWTHLTAWIRLVASKNASLGEVTVASVLLVPVKCLACAIFIFAGILLSAWLLDWYCVHHLWNGEAERLAQVVQAEFDSIGAAANYVRWHRWAVALAN